MRTIVRLILTALLATSIICAQQPGQTVRITETNGQQTTGAWRSRTGGNVVIGTSKGERSIAESEVRRIEVRSGGKRIRNLAIGAGIGVAVGVTVDNTLGTRLRNESGDGGRAITYAVSIGIGAALGALTGGWRTVYSR